MHLSTQLVSIGFAALVFAIVFEMVRRRYLRERYAILWLGAALTLLVLAAWRGLLTTISSAVGIRTPSNAFFVIAFAFLLLLVLHFSAVVSRLADETRVLAQRLALLERRAARAQAEPGEDGQSFERPAAGRDAAEPDGGERDASQPGATEPAAAQRSGPRRPRAGLKR